jgi:hypothetical protein
MLRGTRTQYLRRQRYLLFIAALPAMTIFLVPLVLCTGWWRVVGEVVLPPICVLYILVAVAKLTDNHSYRERARLEQNASLRRGPIYFPAARAHERALAFVRRLFGRRDSN